ncbi:NUDIX hydrolase [Thermovirga lienii DSM 17291]|uniref:NUDIX hydrolase n=2 Tax=Thermovirga TaxID=336260 RepID=G7V9D9_THELD|nr:CoA pyrophosphatase [Thermovirga lienii]AER66489.1 NUDIX hydrolase [Thermovirga lienii DSM 17291]HCD72327.1 CoA pyrophosphatase [Thermovirga lienii]
MNQGRMLLEDKETLVIVEWLAQKNLNKRNHSGVWIKSEVNVDNVVSWASLPNTGRRQSAVIIPYVKGLKGKDALLLIEKSKKLRHHAGQMAFPGGAREDKDVTPLDTALRELHEEVGISPERVEVVEALPKEYVYSSDFVIYPYLAYIDGEDLFGSITLDEEELAAAVLVDIKRLPVPPKFRWKRTLQGVIVYPEFYLSPERTVWGATARMLWRFLRRYYYERR